MRQLVLMTASFFSRPACSFFAHSLRCLSVDCQATHSVSLIKCIANKRYVTPIPTLPARLRTTQSFKHTTQANYEVRLEKINDTAVFDF